MKNKLFKSNKILIHQKIKAMDSQSMNNLLSKLAGSLIFKSKISKLFTINSKLKKKTKIKKHALKDTLRKKYKFPTLKL